MLLEIVEKELKIFYFKAFKRRSKSLETLDLIQECYSDQISLFNEYLERLLKSFKEKRTKSLLIEDLIKFKNLEGCNKKIMKSLIAWVLSKKLYDLMPVPTIVSCTIGNAATVFGTLAP